MKRQCITTVFASALTSACGGGGSSGAASTPVTPAPIVTLSLSAAKVWVGDKVTLTWAATNATETPFHLPGARLDIRL